MSETLLSDDDIDDALDDARRHKRLLADDSDDSSADQLLTSCRAPRRRPTACKRSARGHSLEGNEALESKSGNNESSQPVCVQSRAFLKFIDPNADLT